ncbi:MAG: DUF4389 domain-containing protein [Arthrobacter oryzae]
MKPGRIAMLVLGTLSAIAGLGLLAGAGISGWANYQQREGRFYTSTVEYLSHNSHALTSPGLDLASGQNVPDAAPADLPASIMLRGKATDPAGEIFLGIAPRSEVDAYLAGVEHAEIAGVKFEPFLVQYREFAGTTAPARPADQGFWTASASGPGQQELTWNLKSGDWAVVIMNAEAGRPVAVELQAGARSDLLWPIFLGLLIGGLILLVVGVPLVIAGAAGLGRGGPPSYPPSPSYPLPPGATQPYAAPGAVPSYTAPDRPPVPGGRSYPARLSGYLDPNLSRWLWLVKWFLAIPHYVVLVFLWFAFIVTTIAAWFAILFTGRYPRALFNFNVGVIRWSWRVAFYAYGVLGTDRYPPFTLARTDYPADFDVDYPDRLSRGLVLVKSWLLAIPHLLIIAVVAGSVRAWAVRDGNWVQEGAGVSLLGLLVFIAGVILLFTGRYRRGLFDLLLGLNRWIYRVLAYAALMRDEYPPFHLDQGPADPGDPQPADDGDHPPGVVEATPPRG